MFAARVVGRRGGFWGERTMSERRSSGGKVNGGVVDVVVNVVVVGEGEGEGSGG